MKLRWCLVALTFASLTGNGLALAQIRPAPRLTRSEPKNSSPFDGITVGSSLEQARRALGGEVEEFNTEISKTDGSGQETKIPARMLSSQGASVTLEKLPGMTEYTVTTIDVRGSEVWVTPGLVVGMPIESLKALMGEPDLDAIDGGSGAPVFHYSFHGPTGNMRIHIGQGVIQDIEIQRRESLPR